MSSVDKLIRVIVALILGVLILTNEVSGVFAIILGIFAVVFLLTSFVGFCPLYAPFGLSTLKKSESK